MAKATTNTAANLTREVVEVNDGLDSKVIVNALGDIPGGRTLDMSAWTQDILRSGHIIIEQNGIYKPLPTNAGGTAYASIPSGANAVGVLRFSLLATDPRAAIVTIGQINAAASPYPVTTAIKNALPRIEFLYADA